MGNALFGVAEMLFWVLAFWCYGSLPEAVMLAAVILGHMAAGYVMDRPGELPH